MNKIIKPVINISSNKLEFSSVNIITNIFGYFCRKGKRHILEKKYENMHFKRAISKKKTAHISIYLNSFIKSTTPYIKVKPKKSRNRNKMNKALLVHPIDQISSKRKAYINFFSFFKGSKNNKKSFIPQLETEFESIYLSISKSIQSSTNKPILIEKRDTLHQSAYKFIPYKFIQKKKLKHLE